MYSSSPEIRGFFTNRGRSLFWLETDTTRIKKLKNDGNFLKVELEITVVILALSFWQNPILSHLLVSQGRQYLRRSLSQVARRKIIQGYQMFKEYNYSSLTLSTNCFVFFNRSYLYLKEVLTNNSWLTFKHFEFFNAIFQICNVIELKIKSPKNLFLVLNRLSNL